MPQGLKAFGRAAKCGVPCKARLARLAGPPRELVAVFALAYVPLFLAYFAHSFTGISGMGAGLTTIPVDFWIQEELLITTRQIELAYFTIGMPWVAKILVGHVVDRFSVEVRKRLVFASGALMAAGFIIMAGFAGGYAWLEPVKAWYGFNAALGLADSLPPDTLEAQRTALQSFQMALFTVGFLLVSLAIMLQDVILDPMSRHIVAKVDRSGVPLPEEAYRRKVGLVQTWCRISFNVASVLGMTAALFLMSAGVSTEGIFLSALAVPCATVAAVQFIRLPRKVEATSIRTSIIVLALAVLGLAIWAQVGEVAYAREWSFALTFAVIMALVAMLYRRDTRSSAEIKRGLFFTILAIFLMRLAPEFGPGVGWWHREVLGFDRQFETHLGIASGAVALSMLLFLYRYALRGHLGWILIILNFVFIAFSSVELGFWYGLHEWFGGMLGIDPLRAVRIIAWVDTAATSPFLYVYSLIAFVILAQYADDVGTATWFTVFAMFLNLGGNASRLSTNYLYATFTVERGKYENGILVAPGNYDELGAILWTSMAFKLVVPTVVVLFFLTPWRHHSKPYAYALWRHLRRIAKL